MHSIAPSPLASHGIEGVPVRPAQLANLGLHADVAIGVGQQGLDGDEHLDYGGVVRVPLLALGSLPGPQQGQADLQHIICTINL